MKGENQDLEVLSVSVFVIELAWSLFLERWQRGLSISTVWLASMYSILSLVQIVWCRLSQWRGGCGEQRVGELCRVRQWTGALGSPPVGHEPAGDCDGHGHQSQQGSDHERYDKSYFAHAHIFIPTEACLGINSRFCSSFNGKDCVGLDLNLFSQLAGVNCGLFAGLSLLSSISICASTVLGLALAEANSDIALEPDVVAGRELESIEDTGEDSALTVIVPLSEDGGVGGTSILVGHQV